MKKPISFKLDIEVAERLKAIALCGQTTQTEIMCSLIKKPLADPCQEIKVQKCANRLKDFRKSLVL